MKKEIVNRKKRSKETLGSSSRSLRKFLELPYKMELEPLSKEDGGGFLATIPLLRGCQSDGKTPDEAIQNLREAQKAWITSALKHGDPIPLPQ